ncbi:MAG: hypothetical protein KGH91_05545, partial [Rhodospirillales bacterium]|nr:hypothetical protein [Rhodospirillales bacterium]
ARAAVMRVYGPGFLSVKGESLYPRKDFFNSEDHLVKPCQFAHSVAVAERLGKMLGRSVVAPGAEIARVAGECP